MNDIQKRAVVETLSKPGEGNKYYVYALCEKHGEELTPFYIGKGQGDRVWQHELGAFNEQKKRDEIRELAINLTGPEAKVIAAKEISAKYARIEEIGSENIVKIIIKWGMTSDEAFMAESALINLLNMNSCSFPAGSHLTNIANGHASKGEKLLIGQSQDTMARSVEQFFEDCAQAPLCYEEDICGKGIRAIFISVNNTYPRCTTPEALRNSARGFWRVRATNLPSYLFAVFQGKIVGIYRITGIKAIMDMSDFPDSGLEDRNSEKSLIMEINKDCCNAGQPIESVSISMLRDSTICLLKKLLNANGEEGKSFEEKFRNWLQRKYYICTQLSEDTMLSEYQGRMIVRKDGSSVIPARNEKKYSF